MNEVCAPALFADPVRQQHGYCLCRNAGFCIGAAIFPRVSKTRRTRVERRRPAGCRRSEPSRVPRIALAESLKSCAVGSSLPTLAVKISLPCPFEINLDFTDAEDAHGDCNGCRYHPSFRRIETVTRNARVDAQCHQPRTMPRHDHRDCFHDRAMRQHHGRNQAKHHQRENSQQGRNFSAASDNGGAKQRRAAPRTNPR